MFIWQTGQHIWRTDGTPSPPVSPRCATCTPLSTNALPGNWPTSPVISVSYAHCAPRSWPGWSPTPNSAGWSNSPNAPRPQRGSPTGYGTADAKRRRSPKPPRCCGGPTWRPSPTPSSKPTSTYSPRSSSPVNTTNSPPTCATKPNRWCSTSSSPSAPTKAPPGCAGSSRKSSPATAKPANSKTTNNAAGGRSTCPPAPRPPPASGTTSSPWTTKAAPCWKPRSDRCPNRQPNPETGEPDPRPVGRRRGQALIEALRRSVTATGTATASPKAVLVLTMDFEALKDQLGAATALGSVAQGCLLAADTARKLACDAAIIPTVLGRNGEILDQGREVRLFTLAQIRALWLRDKHCTFPRCDAPAAWSDAHHLIHWADGGPTNLAQRQPALPTAPHHRPPRPTRRRGHRPRRRMGPPGRLLPTTRPDSREQSPARPGRPANSRPTNATAAAR